MQFADTSALVLITADIDITIQSSTLSNIGSWNTEAILVVETSGSIIADRLVIQDCSAAEYLISLKAAADPGAQVASAASTGIVTVQDSMFTGRQQQPSMLISSLSTIISNSTFSGASVPFELAAVVNVTAQAEIQIVASNFRNLMTSAIGFATVILQADTVGISKSRFVGNKGAYGAIAVGGSATTLTMSDSYFEANEAIEGGAAFIQCAFATISDCHFANNTAWRGGAVSMRSRLGSITGCLFDSNIAQVEELEAENSQGGGAVLLTAATVTLDDYHVNTNSNVSITSSRFISNQGLDAGGGIEATGIENLDIDNCVFEQSRGVYGSAINVHSVSNVLLRNSLITTSSGVGVVFGYCYCVGIMNSTFTNATQASMYIFNQKGEGSCEDRDPFGNSMFNRSLIANTEEGTALVIEWMSSSTFQVTVAIWNSLFTNHFLLDPDLASQYNSTVSGSATAALSIDAASEAYVLLAGVVFADNYGGSGAAFTQSFGYKTVLWGCTFANNTATRYGAALCALKSKHLGSYLLGNTTLVNNRALRGGAIYGDATMDLRIFSSLLVNNTASSLGGAMYCDACRLVAVYESIVKDNSAGHEGGGIYCDTCVQVVLIDTLLLSNRWALDNVVLYHCPVHK